jgi:hypothetical protein
VLAAQAACNRPGDKASAAAEPAHSAAALPLHPSPAARGSKPATLYSCCPCCPPWPAAAAATALAVPLPWPAAATLLLPLTIGPGGGGRCQSQAGGNMPASSTAHTHACHNPAYALAQDAHLLLLLTPCWCLQASRCCPSCSFSLKSLQDVHMCTKKRAAAHQLTSSCKCRVCQLVPAAAHLHHAYQPGGKVEGPCHLQSMV